MAVVALAQFMVILDASVVNVALPMIKHDVGFSEQSLSWILNAYTLIFGALFVAGIALFSGASVICGVSQFRGHAASGQGSARARRRDGLAGGALDHPHDLRRRAERNRALAVWGAIAGAGGAVGLLLGGAIVQALSWRWVFFINVPIGSGSADRP